MLAGAILFVLMGCASVSVVKTDHLNDQILSPGQEPIAHIRTDNWGYYLFRWIPLVSGNLKHPSAIQFPVFFRNVCNEKHVVDALTKKSKELGANVTTDIRTRDRSGWLSYTLIFWLMEMEASGNASKMPPPPATDGNQVSARDGSNTGAE